MRLLVLALLTPAFLACMAAGLFSGNPVAWGITAGFLWAAFIGAAALFPFLVEPKPRGIPMRDLRAAYPPDAPTTVADRWPHDPVRSHLGIR